MRKKGNRLICISLILVLGALLAGCATAPSATAPSKSTEDYLVQAGFQMRSLDSPQILAKCEAMPQRQVVWHQIKGKSRYVYADAGAKKFYVGDDAAYERFLNLIAQDASVQHTRPTSPQREDPEFWTMWEDRYGGR